MNIYKEMIDIRTNKVVIILPKDFCHGKAEVRITPMDKKQIDLDIRHNVSKRQKFRDLLLERPRALTDEEIGQFMNNSKWVRKWKTEVF